MTEDKHQCQHHLDPLCNHHNVESASQQKTGELYKDDFHRHEHGNHHQHSLPSDKKILTVSFMCITFFMAVEFWGGWRFNSLALLADAGHMANDSLSLLIALLALFLSTRKQYYLAGLNGLSLIVVAMMIMREAVVRWHNPVMLDALPMIGVAVLGLIVNISVAWIMLKSNHENLNIKAAYLHVIADLFGSLVAITAGLSAYFFSWQWVDLVASFILGFFILKSGWEVLWQAIQLLRKRPVNSD